MIDFNGTSMYLHSDGDYHATPENTVHSNSATGNVSNGRGVRKNPVHFTTPSSSQPFVHRTVSGQGPRNVKIPITGTNSGKTTISTQDNRAPTPSLFVQGKPMYRHQDGTYYEYH